MTKKECYTCGIELNKEFKRCDESECQNVFCYHCVENFKHHGVEIKVGKGNDNAIIRRIVLCPDCAEDSEDVSKCNFFVDGDRL